MDRHDFENIFPMVMDVESDMKLMYNYVIVEYDPKQNEKTPSGIYAPVRSTSREVAADYVPRVGTVVKLPQGLYFHPKDNARGMRWKTTIELEVGDQVWMNFLTAHDWQFKWEGKNYKVVLYEDIICAKRKGEVIMVNGYMLLKPVYELKKALFHEQNVMVQNQGIIAYIGLKNEVYLNTKQSDSDLLQVGDLVVFNAKESKKLRFLESALFKKFDGNMYWVAQRYMVDGILENSE